MLSAGKLNSLNNLLKLQSSTQSDRINCFSKITLQNNAAQVWRTKDLEKSRSTLVTNFSNFLETEYRIMLFMVQ